MSNYFSALVFMLFVIWAIACWGPSSVMGLVLAFAGMNLYETCRDILKEN